MIPNTPKMAQAGLAEPLMGIGCANCIGDSIKLYNCGINAVLRSIVYKQSIMKRDANGNRIVMIESLKRVPATKHRQAAAPPHRNWIPHQMSAYAQGFV